MENPATVDQAKAFLRANSFYGYQETLSVLAENFYKEYEEIAVPVNKRNLIFDTTWENITTFGAARELLIIELGGSYLKLFKAQISAQNTVHIPKHQTFQFYEDIVYTPEILFTNLKNQLDSFLSLDERKTLQNAVFIFTFPLEQYRREDGYIDAICNYFGKTRKSEGIVGLKVGESFQDYIRKNSYPEISISVTNDTPIGLLAAKAVEIEHKVQFDAVINIIVGTGTNIASGFNLIIDGKKQFFIVNTEFGNFVSAPLSRFDETLNNTCDTKDQHLTGKMISGIWHQQIFKIMVDAAMAQGLIVAEEIQDFKFTTLDSGEIEKYLKSHNPKSESLQFLEVLWYEITNRSAVLCGLVMANIMRDIKQKMDMPQLKIGIVEVGSVIEKAFNFKKVLRETIDMELARHDVAKKIDYQFYNPSFQSALGSAIFDSLFQKD